MDVDFENFACDTATLSICTLARARLAYRSHAAADTAESFYLNVESKYGGARGSSAHYVTLVPSAARADVIVNEARASACSTDQIVAAGSEKRDHLHQPDQGELADKQRLWQGVQELRLHTTP